MKPAYYNEIDPYAARWLRNLIKRGVIADGDVDERSIEDVRPDDLRGYAQCHFFAGVGIWSYALRRAGWPDDRPVWTGSCPCQPFSAAGQGLGFADERHLWPAFHWLIEQRRPPAVYGEQVASKAVDPWLDLVQADLEAVGYAFGAVAFPSAGVGAPHIRDRTYWVGHADHAQLEGHAGHGGAARWAGQDRPVAEAGVSGGLADHHSHRLGAHAGAGVHDAEHHADPCGGVRGLADANDGGRFGRRTGEARDGRDAARLEPERLCDAGERPGPTNGYWRDADWLGCRDGKWRPVEPGTFPLAHGAPARVGRLRAYGNACNVEAATEFILASGRIQFPA